MNQLADPQLFARTVADRFIAEHNLLAEYQASLPNTPVHASADFFTRDNAYIEAQASIWLAAARILVETAGLKWNPRYERVERSSYVPGRLL